MARAPGMDHPHHGWSPIVTRRPLRWPEGARVALSVIVNLEQLEWDPPEGSYQPPGLYDRPLPEYRAITHREYGHRVGVFRVLDALERHRLRPTVAMDALTAANYPYLVKHCQARGAEIIAHGEAPSRMITSAMSEAEERRYIRDSIEAVAAATGTEPRGWLGPNYGESTRTPRLLAEAGVRYVCDWVNDEQPYPMTVPGGALYALPILLEIDDHFALRERRFPVDGYGQLIARAFDRMYRDATRSGRLLVLNLHPWLIGQPFRIGYLEAALAHIMRRKRVWAASGAEVVDWYRKTII